MNKAYKTASAVLLSGLWINASEFFRNEILLADRWNAHYRSLGLTFPNTPANGMAWCVWGFVFAAITCMISRKFTFIQTGLIGWTAAFVMMWLVIGNLAVLPWTILPYAIPLSLLEAFGAAWICGKIR